MSTDNFQSAIAVVRSTPVSSSSHWRLVAKLPWEGAQEVAVSESQLLVVFRTVQGDRAFSLETGEPSPLPPEFTGQPLVSATSDGWSVEQLGIDWPQVTLVLKEPTFVDYLVGPFSIMARPTDVLTWGFSPSGSHLVLATEQGFAIWQRI